jgi:hypothetical protein
MIVDHKKEIMGFNVEFVRYMEIVQKVVDCNHYSKSYDL